VWEWVWVCDRRKEGSALLSSSGRLALISYTSLTLTVHSAQQQWQLASRDVCILASCPCCMCFNP